MIEILVRTFTGASVMSKFIIHVGKVPPKSVCTTKVTLQLEEVSAGS